MSTDINDNPQPDEEEITPAEGQEEARIPRSRLNEVIKQREEAKAKLAKLEKEAADRLQQEQLAKGQFQEVIAELQPKAARAERLEETVAKLLQAEIEAIPEAYRKLVPDKLTAEDKLEWIADAKASGLFSPPEPIAKPLPVPTNAGEGRRSEGSGSHGLSALEIQAAKDGGMTLEEYAAYKQRQPRS